MTLIPGGSLFSKRPEMYCSSWPKEYVSSRGITVTTPGGRVYKDFSNFGVGAAVLGYRDEDVDRAVIKAISQGVVSSLNCPEERELAEMLLGLHPWAGKARFTRSGGEAVAVAVRIARAATGRDRVLTSGYHGWHDWYLAGGGHLAGLTRTGVPTALWGLTTSWPYNDLDAFKRLVFNPNFIDKPAAVVMEVERDTPPNVGYLAAIQRTCADNNIVVIFDEITSGFRVSCGGIHMEYGVYPDIAVFGKAMGNGYPIAAIIGTEGVMDAANSTFISSTNWTERVGFAAGIATINKFIAWNVDEHLISIGRRVKDGMLSLGIPSTGLLPLLHFHFPSLTASTIFTEQMLKLGYLAGRQFYASYSHTQQDVTGFLAAARHVLTSSYELEGEIAQAGFKRLA